MAKIAVFAVVALALSVPAMMVGQGNGDVVPAQSATRAQDKIIVLKGPQVQAQLAQLVEKAKATRHGDANLVSTGNIAMQLSVMTHNGPGELHRNSDDLLIVQKGSATVVTGGTMLNGKDRAAGNTYGSGLEGGESTTIRAGDIVIIPAGLTHQLLVPPGTILSMIVGKIQEPAGSR